MRRSDQNTKITPRTIEALQILRDKKPKSASGFARLFWPGYNMHVKGSNAGTHGSRRGNGAWLCAGSYLAKLERRGLVRKQYDPTSIDLFGIASLTNAGEDALREFERGRTSYGDQPTDIYEAVARTVARDKKHLVTEYCQEVGVGQFGYYRFGLWLEKNWPDEFEAARVSPTREQATP